MIAMFAIAALLVGVVLGSHLKVGILVPAVVFASAVALAIGTAHGDSLWSNFLALGLTITALQMGYITGTFVRFGIAGARFRKASRETIGVAHRSAR
jgi:hypothetical protein